MHYISQDSEPNTGPNNSPIINFMFLAIRILLNWIQKCRRKRDMISYQHSHPGRKVEYRPAAVVVLLTTNLLLLSPHSIELSNEVPVNVPMATMVMLITRTMVVTMVVHMLFFTNPIGKGQVVLKAVAKNRALRTGGCIDVQDIATKGKTAPMLSEGKAGHGVP